MEEVKKSVLHSNRTAASSIYKITLVDRDTGKNEAYSYVVADNYTEVALACLRQVNKLKFSLKIQKVC